MPIGSTNVYNPGDLILSTVSGSGTSFIETKIIAATSSFILFNSSGTLTSASLNSIVATTSSYVSGSTSIITNLTAINISASVISSSNAYFSDIGFTNQTVAPDTSVFPTGSTSDGLILDGGTYTNGLYRTRFVKVDRSANLPLYIQETTSTSGSFRNLARFGTHANSPNTFEVFGSTNIQGAITSSNFVGPHIGNTTGTASWSTNALTASFLPVGTYNITSSWAQNVVSASFATTAQTANALNTGNSYTISGLTNNSTLSQQGTLSMGSGYQILATTGTAPIPGISFVGDTNTGIYAPSADTIGFSISGSERVRIDSSGNVGIGTSSPTQKLDIVGSYAAAGDSSGILKIRGGATGADTQLNFGVSADNGYGWIQATDVGLTNNINIILNPLGGNVGIGTTNPTARLHVSGSTGGVFEVDTVGGTTAFYVSASGNVGIGTPNPLGRLHITASATNGESLVYLSKGSGSITQYYINAVNQLGQLNYRVSSDINGHAQQTLYFAGTAHVYHDSYWSSYINNANYTQGGLGIGTSSVIHGYGLAIARPATSGSLYVSGSSVFTGSVSIRDNVGIGTTSTSDKLSVVSGSTRIASAALAGILYLGNDGNNIYLERDNSYDLSLVQNGDSNSALYLASAGSVYVNIDSNNNDTDKAFIVQNNALKAGTELFRVQENGNVGIGTTVPTAFVDIQGANVLSFGGSNTGSLGTIFLAGTDEYNSGTAGAGIYFRGKFNSAGTTRTTFGAISGIKENNTDGDFSGALTFFARSGSNTGIIHERMRIGSSGNVGIGTTNPTARLHVSGSTIISGSLNVTANITCLSLTETSTEAVKYNILPLPSQLDNVLKLKPVSFNYKANDKHSIGLIAEEVAKIYPEFTSDNNDSISYGKITSVLIQSIKELKTIIDNQQKQIEDLSNKLK